MKQAANFTAVKVQGVSKLEKFCGSATALLQADSDCHCSVA
jgi:hypothetical protein